jgi:hypothetical protein
MLTTGRPSMVAGITTLGSVPLYFRIVTFSVVFLISKQSGLVSGIAGEGVAEIEFEAMFICELLFKLFK